MPYEGQTGTAPDGTRVVYRGGKIYPVDQAPAPKGVQPSPQDAEYLSGLRTQASKSLNTATQAQRFMAINKDHGTGGAMSLPFVSDIAAGLSAPYGEMESITSAVAPGLRPPGSGSSSDKDVKFYRRGFPNLDTPGPANQETTERLHKQSDMDAAHSAFLDSWYQHKGTLLGGEQAFMQYWAKKSGGNADGGMTVNLPGGATAIVRPR